jgi:4-hydroxybenzoate polyprenyltransferase
MTTILWSFVALAVAMIYPFAKRFFAMPQAVLGIAFSFGIPMAFAAVQNNIMWMAWFLLLGNLFWVLAYDTEYAMVDRDDDLIIGMKTSAITLGRYDVMIVALCYLVNMIFMAAAGVFIAYSAIYFIALFAALLQAIWHIWLIRHRERDACFKAFRLNHWYGCAVFVGVFLQYLVI